MELELRPLQKVFAGSVNSALSEVRRLCAVAPTGFGKAVVITFYAKKITEKSRRLLVVTNRRILVEQLAKQCSTYKVPFGIIMADSPQNREATVQVASIQTLKVRKWKDMPPADWVIIDEAHQVPQATDALFNLYPNAKCLGVTATPVGPGGKTLLGLYDRIIEPVKNTELISGKWLLPTRCYAPSEPDVEGVWIDKAGVERKGVTVSSSGEYSQNQLAQVVERCTVAANVFKWWEPYSDMQTLVFVPRVKYAYGLAEQFREFGVKADVIEGATKRGDRKATLTSFEDTDARILLAVDVLREGFDCPVAQCGIDLQPNFQFRSWWQKLGRVRRPHGDQEKAIWLDFAGNLWRHGIHPDENPPWDQIVDDKTTAEVLDERAGRKCKVCGSKAIKKGRCQDCGADCTNGKKPWQCPECRYSLSPWERLSDGKCPNCGHKIGRQVRRIRMADGQMREVSADECRYKAKSKATDAQKAWDSARYRAFHSKRPLSFARWLYHEETGNWPDSRALKHCPDRSSGDWARQVGEVFPWMKKRERTHA